MERCRRGEADADAPEFATRRASRRGEGVVDLREDRLRVGKEGAAGPGQLHAARFAAEELRADFALMGADLLAERRLLHVEPFGRACDVAFFSDGDEIAKVAQLHLPYLADMDLTVCILSINGSIGRIAVSGTHKDAAHDLNRLDPGHGGPDLCRNRSQPRDREAAPAPAAHAVG